MHIIKPDRIDSDERKWLAGAMADAADYNSEFSYSDAADFLGSYVTDISRNHAFWGEFLRGCKTKSKSRKYYSDEEYREKTLSHNRNRKRRSQMFYRFIDDIDTSFALNVPIVLDKDFRKDDFSVIALLYKGRATIPYIAHDLGRASTDQVRTSLNKMKREGIVESRKPGTRRVKYSLTDRGYQLMDYLARNVVGADARKMSATGRNRS